MDSAQDYRKVEQIKEDRVRSMEFLRAKRGMQAICEEMDTDKSGTVELHEFIDVCVVSQV